jgi:hypothetical protein
MISRIFSSGILPLMISIATSSACLGQSLSEASQATTSRWSEGYMGLGGNLGQVIERKRVRPAKAITASRQDRHPNRRHESAQRDRARATSEETSRQAPIFLIAQSLDHSGLTINTLRLQRFP